MLHSFSTVGIVSTLQTELPEMSCLLLGAVQVYKYWYSDDRKLLGESDVVGESLDSLNRNYSSCRSTARS